MKTSSQIFLVIFFFLIAGSIVLTYYKIVVQKDYVTFTDPNTIPEPVDVIGQIFGIGK